MVPTPAHGNHSAATLRRPGVRRLLLPVSAECGRGGPEADPQCLQGLGGSRVCTGSFPRRRCCSAEAGWGSPLCPLRARSLAQPVGKDSVSSRAGKLKAEMFDTVHVGEGGAHRDPGAEPGCWAPLLCCAGSPPAPPVLTRPRSHSRRQCRAGHSQARAVLHVELPSLPRRRLRQRNLVLTGSSGWGLAGRARVSSCPPTRRPGQAPAHLSPGGASL